MKKTILINLKYLAFALVLAFGTSVLADWANPTATPPSGNIAIPLHVGPYQVKEGGLSVNGFAAYNNSAFSQHITLDGIVRGGVPTDNTSTVTLGDPAVATTMLVSGNVASNSYIQSLSVANTANKTLCADVIGAIYTCNSSDKCLNFSGEQTTVPAGHTQNSQGNCIPNTGLQYITSGYNRTSATTLLASQSDPNNDGVRGDEVLKTVSLDTSNIVTNQISGFRPTYLDQYEGDVGSKVWNVQQAGNYKIVFNSKGNIQTYAVRRGRTVLWVDFYLRINGTDILLAPINSYNKCGGHPNYVGFENITSQYIIQTSCSGNNGRKHRETVYYNLNFDRTYALNPGDTVELYGTMKGHSVEDNFFGFAYRDYEFRVNADRTYFEVTKLP